ncbi:MAG: polysaccharide deacetylase family protein [bacterium]
MNRIGFIISSRGLRNSMERSFQIVNRFGITPSRMRERLRRYMEKVGEFGTSPSFPLTAVILDRNPDVAKMIKNMGAEICIHGLVHNDLSRLSFENQYRHIREAINLFKRHGIEFDGFRSPYLKHNSETLKVVADLGFKYDSSTSFYWEPTESFGLLTELEQAGLNMGLSFYNPLKYPTSRSLPWIINGIVEIPVSLPDDEILLDRMHLSPHRVGDIWESMLATAIERGEALIVQLHPERFDILKEQVSDVLRLASRSKVWLANLKELASWWIKRMQLHPRIDRSLSGEYMIVGFSDTDSDPYLEVPERGTRIEVSSVKFLEHRPLIRVDKQMPDDIKQKIKEMGYLIEITDDVADFALSLDATISLSEIEKSIRLCKKPILRAPLWPKGYRAACAITGDIDCLTLGDFIRRFIEDRR